MTREAMERGPNAARRSLTNARLEFIDPGYLQEVDRLQELRRQAKIKREIAERTRDESPNQLKYLYSGAIRGKVLAGQITEAQEAEAAVGVAADAMTPRSINVMRMVQALDDNSNATRENSRKARPQGGN
jgi:hypothetical protein